MAQLAKGLRLNLANTLEPIIKMHDAEIGSAAGFQKSPDAKLSIDGVCA